MVLRNSRVSHTGDGRCSFSAQLESRAKVQEIAFYVDRAYEGYFCAPNLDPFVIAALIPAMQSGEDLHVEGTMSEKLFYHLDNYLVHLLNILEPKLQKIRIYASHLNSSPLPSALRGIGTGFSGGIDSFCVLADHYFNSTPSGYQVTHLVLNNVGSHGSGGRALFLERYGRLQVAADEMRLPFVKIDSNFDDFLHIGFQQTVTVRNAAAILALQPLFKRYLVASSFQYRDCHVSPTYDSSYFDPTFLHMFSTETTEFVSSGSQYSRVEKTRRVSKVPLSTKYLDVCVDPNAHGNCSVCFKCARTILTLELLGKGADYSGVFNRKRFEGLRSRYLGELMLSSDPFAQELKELMTASAARYPGAAYLFAASNCIPKPVRRLVRKLVPKKSAK